MEAFGQLNWIAVIVATIAGFLLGAIWYNQRVFGKMWVADLGRPIDPNASMVESMTIGFLTTLIGAIGLAFLIEIIPIRGGMSGLKMGAFVGIFFIAATQLSDGGYTSRPWRSRLIDAGYRILEFAGMGALIGWFTTN